MKKIACALTSPARLLLGRCLLLLITTVIGVGLLTVSGCGSDPAEVEFPTPPPEESRKWLFDVYGNSANDVYVAGNLGTMFHFDGASWTSQDMGTTAAVTTIWSPPTESRSDPPRSLPPTPTSRPRNLRSSEPAW